MQKLANPGPAEKWPLKWCVVVCALLVYNIIMCGTHVHNTQQNSCKLHCDWIRSGPVALATSHGVSTEHLLTFRIRHYVVMATKPLHQLQIHPTVQN